MDSSVQKLWSMVSYIMHYIYGKWKPPFIQIRMHETNNNLIKIAQSLTYLHCLFPNQINHKLKCLKNFYFP